MNRLLAIVNRVMGKHLPPEQPHTGRMCANCHEPIGRNDKFKQLVVAHDNCSFPQGSPLPPSLERLTGEGL